MRTKNLWASLGTQSFLALHELALVDRDRFVLLDAYLRDGVEEWYACLWWPAFRAIYRAAR